MSRLIAMLNPTGDVAIIVVVATGIGRRVGDNGGDGRAAASSMILLRFHRMRVTVRVRVR